MKSTMLLNRALFKMFFFQITFFNIQNRQKIFNRPMFKQTKMYKWMSKFMNDHKNSLYSSKI